MKKFMVLAIGIGVFLFTLSTRPVAQEKGKFQYIGAKQCKMCHNATKKGAQFKKWSAARHSKAYATLATPKALEIAKAKGIADPQKSDACLKCHVTGHGQDKEMFGKKFTVEEGVGCEVCHGPGSEYKPMKVMKDITAGKVEGKALGLVKPTEKECIKCHNSESPSYKEFKFAEAWKKIEHSMPKSE